MQQLANDQIKEELQSAYEYLAMSAWFEQQSLDGFAHWAKKQSEEEVEHAMKFYRHLLDRDVEVELKAVDKPGQSFKSSLDVFKKALKQEQHITGLIHNMYEKALSRKDYPLQQLLHWFIEEQMEEEDMVRGIIERLELAGESGAGLLMLDNELKERG